MAVLPQTPKGVRLVKDIGKETSEPPFRTRRTHSAPQLSVSLQASRRYGKVRRDEMPGSDDGRQPSRATSIISSWAPARPAACWPIGCRRTRETRAAAGSRRPRQLDLVSHSGRLSVRDRQSARRLDVWRPSRSRASTAAALHYPRGKVIGGSSAINGMIYYAGPGHRLRSVAPARPAGLVVDDAAVVPQSMWTISSKVMSTGAGGEWRARTAKGCQWEILEAFRAGGGAIRHSGGGGFQHRRQRRHSNT